MGGRLRQPVERECTICGTKYLPSTANHLYCSDTCRKEGLTRAVVRQLHRRIRAKLERIKREEDATKRDEECRKWWRSAGETLPE